MCFKNACLSCLLIIILNYETFAVPTEKNSNSEVVVEVPFGETVTLLCRSNDEKHNFLYWDFIGRNLIVGPSNSYDNRKFNYEVLSGNLTIKAVSKAEEGIYNCVSRGVRNDNINIRSVRMVVQEDWEEVYEHDPNVHLFRAVIIIATLMMLSGVAYIGYRIWKNRYRQPSYLVPSEDEDDSGDELFSQPRGAQGETNLGRSNSTDSFEAPGISTDFSSILDTRNNK